MKDTISDPVVRTSPHHKYNEKRVAAFVQDKMEQWFLEAGAVATLRQPVGTMGVSTHAYGGTRMGDDPETNVVDRWGFCHDVPNLGLLGASVMGTSGAHNPTLTAQALAWRCFAFGTSLAMGAAQNGADARGQFARVKRFR